jgi:hypothetical protein
MPAASLVSADEEVAMPRLSRRFTSTVLLSLSLALAAPAVQARELSPASWFDAVAHQLAQWTGGLWTLPAHGATAGQAKSTAVKGRPRIKVDCGGLHDPDGGCSSGSLRR